jgi:hypothetical protein
LYIVRCLFARLHFTEHLIHDVHVTADHIQLREKLRDLLRLEGAHGSTTGWPSPSPSTTATSRGNGGGRLRSNTASGELDLREETDTFVLYVQVP